MTRRRRIEEAIDACRPASDDLHDSGLSFLADDLAQDPRARQRYQRVQQIDAAISAAFLDVPVPTGLEARLLAILESAQGAIAAVEPTRAASSESGDSSAAAVSDAVAALPAATRRFSRRWLTAAAVGMVVAASVAVLVTSLPSAPEVHKDNVADLVREFFEEERRQNPAPGLLAQQHPAPRGFDYSTAILRPANVRWRHVTGLLGDNGVAYDLPHAGGRNLLATLYVVRGPSTLTGLDGSPPVNPLATTGGVTIGAWRAGPMLYVLVVNGSVRQYQSLIRPTHLA